MNKRAWLLLAAAALPLSPVSAQDTTTTTTPPPAETATPPAATAPEPAPAPAPTPPPATVTVTPAPAPEPAASAPAAEPVAVRTARTVRRTTTTRTVARTAAPVRVAPVAAAPVAVAAPAPVAEVPVPAPAAPVAAPPPEAVATPEPAPMPVQEARSTAPIWPWLLLGALLVAGALFLASRRRRRTDVYETDAEDRFVEPAAVAAAPLAAAPLAAAPLAAAPVGEPEIELGMRPIRAGVAGDDARVEFQLTVGNRGDAAAENVRVSTWMLAAGSSEMEQALIEPRADAADTTAVTIGAGESRTLEAAVALPTAGVEGDSVLPVVVADAAWRDADGRERHTRVSYAVGVEVGGELAHFDVDNPSGLHDEVVARPLDALERA
ncbi:MAG: hypothetical protein ACJ8DZ_07260 [Allosphingosinicella sp.]